MVLIDPAEEIRRLIEDEEIDRDEARAMVRADLRKRQTVQETSKSSGPSRKPMNLQWTARAQKRGNLASRNFRHRTPRKTKT